MNEQKDITLVVLAAGMGSRFGGLKQLEPVGPSGEFIIDYSVYDAIQAGFNKVVFIIRKELEEEFHNTIGKRIEPFVKVEYAYQDSNKIPEGVEISKGRTKPLGTAHAMWCAKDKVHENFAIISADDFYGKESFIKIANHLKSSNDFCVMGYKIGDTLSEVGEVKRGICIEKNGVLTGVVESKVARKNGVINCEPLNGSASMTVKENHPVSMLMFGLTPQIMDSIEKDMPILYREHKNEMDTYEFLFPDTIDKMIQNNEVNVKVIPTNAKWYGITYKEDLQNFKNAINLLIEQEEYPSNLWGKKKQKIKRRCVNAKRILS